MVQWQVGVACVCAQPLGGQFRGSLLQVLSSQGDAHPQPSPLVCTVSFVEEYSYILVNKTYLIRPKRPNAWMGRKFD